MFKSKNTNKTTLVLVVAILAAIMTFGPSVSNFQVALAHYGVDKDDCKNEEHYYEITKKHATKTWRNTMARTMMVTLLHRLSVKNKILNKTAK